MSGGAQKWAKYTIQVYGAEFLDYINKNFSTRLPSNLEYAEPIERLAEFVSASCPNSNDIYNYTYL